MSNDNNETIDAGLDSSKTAKLNDRESYSGEEFKLFLKDNLDYAICNSNEKYSFEKLLGQGGMGKVNLCIDKDLRRKVAVKSAIVKQSIDQMEDKQKNQYVKKLIRFIEEAQITSQLEHPNIIPVHEIGFTDEDGLYFTMKEVKGDTLAEVIKKVKSGDKEYCKKYPLPELLRIFEKICDGISFAHSRSVIHRDLKPENIMIGRHGEVLIMDWGLAKILSVHSEVSSLRGNVKTGLYTETSYTEKDLEKMISEKEVTDNNTQTPAITMESQVIGTLQYMPPEQAKGKLDLIDTQSDIFSLGGILYFILTGKTPYSGKTVYSILTKAITGDVQSPLKAFPQAAIPSEIDAIVVKATKKDKAERYETVIDLKNDVRAFLSGNLLKAVDYNPLEIFFKWMKRNKPIVIGLFAVLIALGGLFSVQRIRRYYRIKSAVNTLKSSTLESLKKAENINKSDEKNIVYRELISGLIKINQAIEKDTSNNSLTALKRKVAETLYKKAILFKDWPLAKQGIDAISEIDGKNNVKEMQTNLNKAESKQKTEDIKFVREIIEDIPPEGIILARERDRIIVICTVTGKHITKLLIELINKHWPGNIRKLHPRTLSILRIAITCMGYLGNSKTVHEDVGDDPVTLLTRLLKPINLTLIGKDGEIDFRRKIYSNHGFSLGLAICEAMGNLNDYRGLRSAYDIFLKNNQDSMFWNMTRKHFRRLSIPEKEKKIPLKTALDYLYRGYSKHVNAGYKEAIEDYNEAEKLDKTNYDLYIVRGIAKTALKKYKTAEKDFKKALKSKQNQLKAYCHLSNIYRIMKNYKKSMEYINKALGHSPGKILPHFYKARILFDKKKYKEVLAEADKMVKIDSYHISPYIIKTMTYLEMNQIPPAEKSLKVALKLYPESVDSYVFLGQIYRLKGEFRKAIATFSRAIRYDSSAIAYYNRAIVKFVIKDYEGALKDSTQAIKISSKYTSALRLRANIYITHRKYKEALVDIDKAIEVEPTSESSFYNRGYVKTKMKNHKGAIEDYTKAIKLKPNHVTAILNRGLLYKNVKKYKEAIADFKKLIRLKKFENCYRHIGLIYVEQKKYKLARQYLRQYLQHAPGGKYTDSVRQILKVIRNKK